MIVKYYPYFVEIQHVDMFQTYMIILISLML